MGFIEGLTVGWSVFAGIVCLLVYWNDPDTPRARWAVFGAVMAVEFALDSAVVQENRVEAAQHRLAQAEGQLTKVARSMAAARRILEGATFVYGAIESS